MTARTLLLCLTVLAFAVPAATAAGNPWLDRKVLHMAHQGGEREAPSNTMFAYKKALAAGADMLELDVNVTADRQLVAFHDTSVDNRTNGTGKVNSLTVAELKALDPADTWSQYRGIALGTKAPPEVPEGETPWTAADFQIPTLEEVLQAFPNVLVNIEIKGAAPDGTAAQTWAEESLSGAPTALDAADVLATLLNRYRPAQQDTIVVSFSDIATQTFKRSAPTIHTAPGLGFTAAFYASAAGPLPGAPSPRHVALQPPTVFEDTVEVPTKDFVDAAHANGLAVHVWLASDAEENDALYTKLIENGVDGIMTDFPTRLEATLARLGKQYAPGAAPALAGGLRSRATGLRARRR